MDGKAWWKHLYAQVLMAIAIGALLGHFAPHAAVALKPLGDAFVKLVRMVIGPVILLTVASGIAGAASLRSLGSTTGRALVYFLSVSSLALLIGLVVANLVQPGAGLAVDPTSLDTSEVNKYAAAAHATGVNSFLMSIVPESFFGAMTGSQMLPLLVVAILFGIGVSRSGSAREPICRMLDALGTVFFRIVDMLMRLAPLGALGAIAFTVGNYGLGALMRLGLLVATFYITSALFIVLVLGTIARLSGFSLWRLLVHLKDELWLVLGTSSSESALPRLMKKLEEMGCSKSVVGLVVPTGYSFNLDGTNIYMTLAALFIAQATGVDLGLRDQILLLLVAAVSSKGAAGVTGAGFVTLAATLTVVPAVPAAGIALVLGVDRFMSECRALTNFIGNAVATIVVARWEGALDTQQLKATLAVDRKVPAAGPTDSGSGLPARKSKVSTVAAPSRKVQIEGT